MGSDQQQTASPTSDKRPARWAHVPEWLRLRLTDTQRYLLFWTLAGLLCGAVAVLFHLSIDGIFHFTQRFAARFESPWGYVILVFLPVLGGAISGLISTYIEPTVAGSGIPHTKARYYRDFGIMGLREAFWRFVAGSLCIGSGMSLGREGPTVHICAALASKIGQVFGLAKKRVQAMVPVGMGAGIAAAFNTPLAAMFFVFEELLGDFSSKALFGILIAVVIASIVERSVLGVHPVFDVQLPVFETSWWMLVCIPLGFLAAVSGFAFVQGVLSLRSRFRRWKRCPRWLKPAIGGLSVGLIGATVLALYGNNGVFGIGYRDLSDAMNGELVLLSVLLALFCGKFIATMLAYASGASGGLFAPSLFLGGMLGAILGVCGSLLFGWDSSIIGAIALLGMGAFFAAVIRCPLTSWVIIIELTNSYILILPLLVGNHLAFFLAQKWQPVALYDSLLLQDKINLKKMPNYQGEQDWRNLPVQTIMTFEVVTVDANATVKDNLERISETKHHAYPALDGEGLLAGMITHHELKDAARDRAQTVLREVLPRRPLVTVHPGQSIRDTAQALVLGEVEQAPVVSRTESRKLLGIVTLHDIARQQNAIADSIGR